jgi:hypothetical protein
MGGVIKQIAIDLGILAPCTAGQSAALFRQL